MFVINMPTLSSEYLLEVKMDPNTILSDRRLQRAKEHVSRNWFPVNPNVHSSICEKIKNGSYTDNPHILIADIKSDFALFMFCLREVSVMLRRDGRVTSTRKTPVDLILSAGMPTVQKILTQDGAKISSHTFGALKDFQITELEQSLISASCASTLSEYVGIDPDTAFSTALLRHLGYALIAWNYPSIYQKAITSLQPNQTFDEFLTNALGFSPVTLAFSVISSWGLDREIEQVVCESTSGNINLVRDTEDGTTKILSHICRVSETLARANYPKEHPKAMSNWHGAKKEIENILGPSAIDIIQKKFIKAATAYASILPNFNSESFSINPETRIAMRQRTALSNPNEYVLRCPEKLRTPLLSLYKRMPSDDVASLIRSLMQQVVPRDRFPRGCVYTIDVDLGWLVPQLKFGTLNPKTIPFFSNMLPDERKDPIMRAFNSLELVVESLNKSDSPTCCIVKAIGKREPLGVVYLETDQLLNEVIANSTRDEFNAIAETLSDCLSLV